MNSALKRCSSSMRSAENALVPEASRKLDVVQAQGMKWRALETSDGQLSLQRRGGPLFDGPP